MAKIIQLALITCLVAVTSSCAIMDHANPDDMQCPGTPKCVSSEAEASAKRIATFTFEGTSEDAMARLKAAVQSEDRTTITSSGPNYLNAEAKTQIFGFVDDLKFVLNPNKNEIQVRSSARLGYADFGVNRRRIERIRATFNDQKSK